ncbi:SPFH domain-containing protein [Thioalkalivibrio sp. HK1]|uniref:SPFH domain-containing protein n=1 Tax=Thioalkalivibrio sp. HK1 TaxID=1469245 RepID=UPI0004B03297|nr:stomatin-like protein [Thioalkalivibrio sp. HK1]
MMNVDTDMVLIIVLLVVAVLVIFTLYNTAVVVPQRSEYVIERLGKFNRTLSAGLHFLFPFLDIVAYRRSLKEEVIDIGSQDCITSDNVMVTVDGVLYMQVFDSRMSAYGIENYKFAASQMAQTSLRSAIGKIELDRTFEEREALNRQVVSAIDEAAQNWGVKVLRYEIRDITPPQTVMEAMEKQMRAEREKRAEIAISEGDRQSRINRAEGLMTEAIRISEGEKQKLINEAEGNARQIELIAGATAKGLSDIAVALSKQGGETAARLRVAEQYVEQFGRLAQESNSLILPSDLGNIASIVATAMNALDQHRGGGTPSAKPKPIASDNPSTRSTSSAPTGSASGRQGERPTPPSSSDSTPSASSSSPFRGEVDSDF